MSAGPILIAGAGRMGSALIRGWIADGLGPRLVAVDPFMDRTLARAIRKAGGLALRAPPRDLVPSAIVLAMKPQGMEDAVRPLGALARRAVTISIAAGVPVAKLKAWTGSGAIVRAMPNLPASIGAGVTAAFAARGVKPGQAKLALRLLRASGAVVWAAREAQMNAVTAVSGSGPAYVFLLAEALADAGLAAGLPRALAATLARKTVEGAGALLAAMPETEPGSLRQSVTSPGGTTAAALSVLMAADGLPDLMRRAVAAATARARELGG